MKANLRSGPRKSSRTASPLPPLGGGGGGGGAVFAVATIILLALSLGGYFLSGPASPSISDLAPARPYFNPPQNMRFRVGTDVALTLTPDYIATRQPNSGASAAPALISEEMAAVLRADGATVAALTPEKIGVRMDQPAVWRWRVTPMISGTVLLEPVASAILANQASGAAPYEVYRDEVPISITTSFFDKPKWFIYDHWGAILSVLGFLLGSGLVWKGAEAFLKRRQKGTPAGFVP